MTETPTDLVAVMDVVEDALGYGLMRMFRARALIEVAGQTEWATAYLVEVAEALREALAALEGLPSVPKPAEFQP